MRVQKVKKVIEEVTIHFILVAWNTSYMSSCGKSNLGRDINFFLLELLETYIINQQWLIVLVLRIWEDGRKAWLGSPKAWMESNILELKWLGLIIPIKKKINKKIVFVCLWKTNAILQATLIQYNATLTDLNSVIYFKFWHW